MKKDLSTAAVIETSIVATRYRYLHFLNMLFVYFLYKCRLSILILPYESIKFKRKAYKWYKFKQNLALYML